MARLLLLRLPEGVPVSLPLSPGYYELVGHTDVTVTLRAMGDEDEEGNVCYLADRERAERGAQTVEIPRCQLEYFQEIGIHRI